MALSTHSRPHHSSFLIERLFPSHRGVPAPFSQEECQELMTLIRSFGGTYQISLFFTINILIDKQMTMMSMEPKHALFLRFSSKLVSLNFYLYCLSHFEFWLAAINALAHWRQSCFRPKELLLTNVGSNLSGLPIPPRQLLKWAIIDFFISCLFLCIPYISIEQRTCLSSTRTVDEESGFPDATPTLVIGAYTCLVVRPYTPPLLSKLTFLSLPGLDCFSRTTGMVVILFAAFSIGATWW